MLSQRLHWRMPRKIPDRAHDPLHFYRHPRRCRCRRCHFHRRHCYSPPRAIPKRLGRTPSGKQLVSDQQQHRRRCRQRWWRFRCLKYLRPCVRWPRPRLRPRSIPLGRAGFARRSERPFPNGVFGQSLRAVVVRRDHCCCFATTLAIAADRPLPRVRGPSQLPIPLRFPGRASAACPSRTCRVSPSAMKRAGRLSWPARPPSCAARPKGRH
mmetsp:Transcript_12794/g.26150  ORF Transcript_12794/g.26150 Transcript_12794/m.26150 type:complete len:211 (+) Transcript_12794:319-951(+)